MKGLLTKEWCLIRKNFVFTLIFVIIFTVIGVNNAVPFMFSYSFILLTMLPVNSMTYDESSKWQQYSLAMPYKRSSIVSAKYIMVIISMLIATVISVFGVLYLLAISQDHSDINREKYSLMIIAMTFVGLLIPLITLPINFKFGTVKGRIILLILVGVFAGAVSIYISDEMMADIMMNKLFRFFYDSSFYGIVLKILSILAALFGLSWYISIKVFEHKDL